MQGKLVFISSPYSHWNDKVVEQNYIKVTELAAKLCSEGEIAISPITYGHTLLQHRTMPSDWTFWKDFCLTLLDKCDEMIVYKMEGWERSRGMEEEIKYAQEKNIPIRYIEEEVW